MMTIHSGCRAQQHDSAAVALLSVPELAGRCKAETAHYRRHEPSVEIYGLELFRRGIVQGDDAAWAAIYEQYAGAVRTWLSPWQGEIDEGVNIAFARFWRGLDAHKFSSFGSLAAVLRYLKMCAHATRIDRSRRTGATAREEPLSDAIFTLPAADNVEATIAARSEGAAFWHAVAACCGDERQRRVLYLSYVGGLSPQQIHAFHAAEFPAVAEIYHLKRRALARLRCRYESRPTMRDGHAPSQAW